MIFCGDFNAVPNSGVYKLVTEGALDCSNIDRRRISGQSQGNLINVNPRQLKSTVLKYVTSKYLEKYNQNDNVKLFIYISTSTTNNGLMISSQSTQDLILNILLYLLNTKISIFSNQQI